MGVRRSPTIYKIIDQLKKTGNLHAGVGENIHGRDVVVYTRTDKGMELLRALEVVEQSLK